MATNNPRTGDEPCGLTIEQQTVIAYGPAEAAAMRERRARTRERIRTILGHFDSRPCVVSIEAALQHDVDLVDEPRWPA